MNWVVSKAGASGTAPAEWDVTRAAAAGVAGIGALAGVAHYGFSSRGLVTSCLLGVLGAVAVIDFREHVVPVRLVVPASALLLVMQAVLFPDQALECLVASVLAFGGLCGLWLVKRDGIALSDATLGLLLGAGLGSDVATAMFFGFLAFWPVAVYLVLRDGTEARKASVPLAPAFAVGALLVSFA